MAPGDGGKSQFSEDIGDTGKAWKNQISAGGTGRLPGQPFDCLKRSYDNLHALGYR